MRAVLLVAMILSFACSQTPAETGDRKSANKVRKDVLKLDPRIRVAKVEEYHSVDAAQHWGNPMLFIEQNGVVVILNGIRSPDDKAIAVDELPAALVALPVSAWPLGRVVRIQQNGLLDPSDTTLQTTIKRVNEVLKQLAVVADWMPSA